MKNKVFLAFLVCLTLSAYVQGSYTPEYDSNGRLTLLAGDVNRDGGNDIADIALMAAAWLDEGCGLSNQCNESDVFPDGKIDATDFAASVSFGTCALTRPIPNVSMHL